MKWVSLIFLFAVLCVPSAAQAVAPVFQCASTPVNGTTSGTLACVTTGDWIIYLSVGSTGTLTGTVTCPAGFTQPQNGQPTPGDGNNSSVVGCYKIATAADTSSSTYTATWNGAGSGFQVTQVLDYRGGTTAFDVAASYGNAYNSYVMAPPLYTTRSNDAVVTLWGGCCTTSWVSGLPPTGYTTRANTSSLNSQMAVADTTVATAPNFLPRQFIVGSQGTSNATLTMAFGGVAGGAGNVTMFNCSGGYTHTTGNCGTAFPAEDTHPAFALAGATNGSTPGLSGTAVNIIPTASVHNANQITFQTPVNVQNFNTTFTFQPNGWNTSLVFNNNSQPTGGAPPNIWGGGAGCEADFWQGFSQAVVSNNYFALELSGVDWLSVAAGAFTGSSVQIYQWGQWFTPCIPDLGCNIPGCVYMPTAKFATTPVQLNNPATTVTAPSSDTYSANVVYDGANLTLNLFDVTAGGSCPGVNCYNHTWSALPTEQGGGAVNIPVIVAGNNAYVSINSATNNASTGDELLKTWSYTTALPAPAAPVAGGGVAQHMGGVGFGSVNMPLGKSSGGF